MSSQAEYDYICPVCHEVFRVPVILPCGHSFCRRCVRQFWSGRRARECPVCRRSCRHPQPVVNLALKNLCEEFETRRKRSRPEDMCGLHQEKLKLFCLQDNQPVCVVCFTSQQHDQHTLRPVAEAAAPRKDQLSAALKILQEKLQHRVWRKMENIVQHTPVVLDPNTAHPDLLVSADLSSVRWSWSKRALPDNAERFDHHPCVLASKGVRSGTLSWAVEVRQSSDWTLGVTTELNQRKGWDFFSADVWSVCYDEYSVSERPVFGVRVKQRLERVRVDLDYDGGTISFSDAVNNTHIHTFSSNFTHTLIPFFSCYTIFNLKILPSNSQQQLNTNAELTP